MGKGQNFISRKFVALKKNLFSLPTGGIDLEMLSSLRLKHPGVTVDNEVVEPSGQQLHNYRGAHTHSSLRRLTPPSRMPKKQVPLLLLTANKAFIFDARITF